MSRYDRVALIVSLVAFFAAWFVSERVFENMPHIEDEMAYVWQAQVIAKGRLMLPSPPASESMMVPYVVDYHGNRFGKYPPGWPVVLALGIALNARAWVNPMLAGLAVWLTYLLGKKLFDVRVALLGAFLTLSSPLFLLVSGSLLSHSWALFLSLAFTLAWLDSFDAERKLPAWLTVLTAGFSLGVLALTRPLTAVGVGLPFFFHGLFLLARGDKSVRLRVLSIGLLVVSVAGLLLLWQFAVTSDPFLNPYTLWWKYDRIGFGPGHGPGPDGNTPAKALQALLLTFKLSWPDFLGWGVVSLAFLLFGVLTLGRTGRAWLVASVFPAVVLVYAAYWASAPTFPRYYYEGLFSLTLVCAAGIFRLVDGIFTKLPAQWMRISASAILVLGFGITLPWNLLPRMVEMRNLNGVSRSMLEPFETRQAGEMTPALVIVHVDKNWIEYGGLLELQNADLTSPFIFALSRGEAADHALAQFYPDRHVIEYFTNRPDPFEDFP
jgi:4-amino-4-deoxy-L-arabinose transferase-like glycosyltransferase